MPKSSTIPPSSGHAALSILVLTAILLAGYSLLLNLTGLRADLAESNLQANLIRISRYLNGQPAPVVLAGSSVAGRLLPAYFQESGLEVQNLGLDGSRPLFAFEVIRMRAELPKTILVDTSTLFQPLMENDAVLREAIHSTGWKISAFFPPMRPEYRPSSIFYTLIKAQKEQAFAGQLQPAYLDKIAVESPPQPGRLTQTWVPEDQYPCVREALINFHSRGSKVILTSIPRGAGWGEPAKGLDRKLASELGLPFLEVGVALAEEKEVLSFSDGLHLDVSSARKVVDKVTGVIRQTVSSNHGPNFP